MLMYHYMNKKTNITSILNKLIRNQEVELRIFGGICMNIWHIKENEVGEIEVH